MDKAVSQSVFIGVDYEECHPETYRGITVSYNGEEFLFKGDKNPTADLKTAWAHIKSLNLPKGTDIFNLSSVDHFPQDGGFL